MAHAWNACWVHALGGSNPPSSADAKAALTWNDVGAAFVCPGYPVGIRRSCLAWTVGPQPAWWRTASRREPTMTTQSTSSPARQSPARNVAQQLIASHLVEGEMVPGTEVGIAIDQTLTQDATGTMVMLELEAMGLDRVKTELSAQYVDHNLLQTDAKNPEDHLFLQSAAQRFGLWYSKAGNGVSHPVHQSRFGKPGATMVGSDSHTCAAGAIGMLAIGVGGLEVAMAMAGEPLYVSMPDIWGVELTGELPDWVSAKDV